MDGARYVTDGGVADYHHELGNHLGSGSYASSGTVFVESQEYGYTDSTERKAKPGQALSYRHPAGSTASQLGLNTLYFDAHVEYLLERRTRYLPLMAPTRSVVVDLSRVTNATKTDYKWKVGDLIPD